MKKLTQKEKDEFGHKLNDAAIDLSLTIVDFMHNRPELQAHGMTVLGYATEMIMSQIGGDWDELSANYRDFLALAHKDLRELVSFTNDSHYDA